MVVTLANRFKKSKNPCHRAHKYLAWFQKRNVCLDPGRIPNEHLRARWHRFFDGLSISSKNHVIRTKCEDFSWFLWYFLSISYKKIIKFEQNLRMLHGFCNVLLSICKDIHVSCHNKKPFILGYILRDFSSFVTFILGFSQWIQAFIFKT